MITNLLAWLVLVLVAVLFGWLTWRAGHIRRAIFKWPAVVLSGLFTLLLALVAGASARGLYILYAPHPVPAVAVTVERTPERLARGQHIAEVVCAACHTSSGDLPLAGGDNLAKDFPLPLPLGDVYAPNLTPAGPLASLSDGDIWRLFRYGVLPDGRQTFFMPVGRLHNLSDEDLKSVIAYLRSQPAVDHATPPTQPSLVLATLLGSGLINPAPWTPSSGPVIAPAKGPTAEYGAYIVSFNDCKSCHGQQLDGHANGPSTGAPNLRVVQGWTVQQFVTTLRTGVDPSGHALRPPMPWQQVGRMDDDELTAVYQYLRSLPPVAAKP